MQTKVDTRRVIIFLLFAYGIAIAAALVVYFTGGLQNSPQLFPGSSLSLALVLIAGPYMWAPAISNILTRLVTREGWKNMWLRPNFKRGWKYWLLAWILPLVFNILGAALYFLIFSQRFDSELNSVVLSMPSGVNISPWLFVLIMLVGNGLIVGVLINSVFTFGEEFGWRAYLLQKLLPLGKRKALILMGVIWGVWHWPVIFMGYEYGFNYPGYPYVGPLLFILFTFACGVFLGWASLRARSVWPAVIGHAIINATAGTGFLLAKGTPTPLLGPAPIGLIAVIPWLLFALWVLLSPAALKEGDDNPIALPGEAAPIELPEGQVG